MGTNGAPGLPSNMGSNVPPQQPPIQTQNQQAQQQQQQQQQQLHQQQSSMSNLGPLQQLTQQRPTGLGVGSNNATGLSNRPSGDYGEPQRVGSGSLTGMSDADRYGLNGLTEMIKGDNQDMAMLALGTDLTQLGLDLSQPEYCSLFRRTRWSQGPFYLL